MILKIEETIRVPIKSILNMDKTIQTSFVSFSGIDDGKEHLAVIYGDLTNQSTPYIRIHSECLTGDLFASKRCDCGDQLNFTKEFFEKNSGLILYLRQEGRGIGLYQKLKAYKLQDQGHDTFEANRMLGHGDDERDFAIAANMLLALGYSSCRLLTNNPKKTESLKTNGINVTEVIQIPSFITKENKDYIDAKIKHGHNHVA